MAESKKASTSAVWEGFYKKTLLERQDQLKLLYPHLNDQLLRETLPTNVANQMVENCVGTLSLPMGLGLNFVINGKDFVVPMVVEEPSVIAAVSGAAKTISSCGGFRTSSTGNIMIAQIQLLDLPDPESAIQVIVQHKPRLVSYGNNFCKRMVRRGGGVVDLQPRVIKPKYINQAQPMLVIHVHVDVCESMGANTVNTVAEGLAPEIITTLTQDLKLGKSPRLGLRIVSNLSTERRASATFRIPVAKLNYKGVPGTEVARRILEAYWFAEEDPYRAATHNKGIMNGIDAAAIALGQDWRALEAACHAYAARNGHYGSLTNYRIESGADGEYLLGQLEAPLAVGTFGGTLQTHPSLQYTHGLMGNPDAQTLSQVLACVGLAQNFAALRAMVSEGIQRGHMGLHSHNIAIAAGAPPQLVQEVSQYMISRKRIDIATASDYLKAQALFVDTQPERVKPKQSKQPSTFNIELDIPGLNENPLTLNVVFDTIGALPPVHITMGHHDTPELTSQADKDLKILLFGDKGIEWLTHTFVLLNQIKLSSKAPPRANEAMQNKMKLVSILINIIVHKLNTLHPQQTRRFVRKIIESEIAPLSGLGNTGEPHVLLVGFSLIFALWKIFKHQIEQWVGNQALAHAMTEEQVRILSSLVKNLDESTNFTEFMKVHKKRWQATMFLLCDAQGIPSKLITRSRLHFVVELGSFFEWEGTVAHDAGRWERDLQTKAPNAYLFWLKHNKKEPSQATLAEFLTQMAKVNESRKKDLLSAKEPAEFFDAELFLRTFSVIREHYGLHQIDAAPAANQEIKAKL